MNSRYASYWHIFITNLAKLTNQLKIVNVTRGKHVLKMASNAVKVKKLLSDLNDMERLNDGISVVKNTVHVGNNITPVGFTLLDIVHKWVQREIPKKKVEIEDLSNIQLICEYLYIYGRDLQSVLNICLVLNKSGMKMVPVKLYLFNLYRQK